MKLAWITDIHLNFPTNRTVIDFIKRLYDAQADAVLITGDIATAPSILPCLDLFDQALLGRTFFVLGNHDFYHGAIDQVRSAVSEKAAGSDGRLVFLDDLLGASLTPGVGIIGHSGWADGRLGDYENSPLRLSDQQYILDFEGLTPAGERRRLEELGDEAAAHLEESLTTALRHHDKIICLTHVPPFEEASWFNGKTSDKDYLPHFACKATGDVLKRIMLEKPGSHLTVLCGHTHGNGVVDILPNLKVFTGKAIYNFPQIQAFDLPESYGIDTV